VVLTLLSGAGRDNALNTLRQIHTGAYNLRSTGVPGPAHGRLATYIDWATSAAARLALQFSAADGSDTAIRRRRD
jgi:hypothetical protein